MAVSGLIMIGYLLAHMYGNLKVFAGQDAFDDYAHHLRTLGEPIAAVRGCALGHPGRAAGGDRRARLLGGDAVEAGPQGPRWDANATRAARPSAASSASYASFTLRWGGIMISCSSIYHLLHLTWNVVAPGGASDSPYERVVNGFQIWWVVLVYTIALLAVGFHLRHGVWSALTTLGANTSAIARRRLNLLAYVVAIAITVVSCSFPTRSCSEW